MPLMSFLKSTSGLPALLAVCLVACGDDAGEAEHETAADPVVDIAGLAARVTVSGVSAGGYMAVQAQVALAERIGGAAAIAAGPYHCAAGRVAVALGRCLSGDGLKIAEFVDFARQNAGAGTIAPVRALRRGRAWIFHSPTDAVVSPAAGDALTGFYRAFLPAENIRYENSLHAGHGWPTLANGVACGEMGGEFLNACDFDAAGELLHFLYPDLAGERHDSVSPELRTIAVSDYFAGTDVADSAFAFVPDDCASSARECRLHIAFHGCRQGAEFIGDAFARQAGLNEWADGNQMIVLYPQIESSLVNPQGCWDWWGYTGGDYDLASGAQLTGVRKLIDAFAQGALL